MNLKPLKDVMRNEGLVVVKVVMYNGLPYVWYTSNGAGLTQLIDREGKKFSGTPKPEKLKVVREISCKEFNSSWYFFTKIGVFSAKTGDRIKHPKILEKFVEDIHDCDVCKAVGIICSFDEERERCDVLS